MSMSTSTTKYVFLFMSVVVANYFYDRSYYPAASEIICVLNHLVSVGDTVSNCSNVDQASSNACFLKQALGSISDAMAWIVAFGFIAWLILWAHRMSGFKFVDLDYFLTGICDSVSLTKLLPLLKLPKLVRSLYMICLDNLFVALWMFFIIFKVAVPLLIVLSAKLADVDGSTPSLIRDVIIIVQGILQYDVNIVISFESIFGDKFLNVALFVIYPLLLAFGIIKKKDSVVEGGNKKSISIFGILINILYAAFGALMLFDSYRGIVLDYLVAAARNFIQTDAESELEITSLLSYIFLMLWSLFYGFLFANGCVLEEYQNMCNIILGSETAKPEAAYETYFFILFFIVKQNLFISVGNYLYGFAATKILSLGIPVLSSVAGNLLWLFYWLHGNLFSHVFGSLLLSWYCMYYYRLSMQQDPQHAYDLLHNRWVYFFGFGMPHIVYPFFVKSIFISTFVLGRIGYPISVMLLCACNNAGYKRKSWKGEQENRYNKGVYEMNNHSESHKLKLFDMPHSLARKLSSRPDDKSDLVNNKMDSKVSKFSWQASTVDIFINSFDFFPNAILKLVDLLVDFIRIGARRSKPSARGDVKGKKE